jgi:hypothetical protein
MSTLGKDVEYKEKYLKYKRKYLELKKQLAGYRCRCGDDESFQLDANQARSISKKLTARSKCWECKRNMAYLWFQHNDNGIIKAPYSICSYECNGDLYYKCTNCNYQEFLNCHFICGQPKWVEIRGNMFDDIPQNFTDHNRCHNCSWLMNLNFVHDYENGTYQAPASVCPRRCLGNYRYYCKNNRCRGQSNSDSDSD